MLTHDDILDIEVDRLDQQRTAVREAKESRRTGYPLSWDERSKRMRLASHIRAKRSKGGDYEGKRVSEVPASDKLSRRIHR